MTANKRHTELVEVRGYCTVHCVIWYDQRNHAEIQDNTAQLIETLGLLNEHIGKKTHLLNEPFSMADISASVEGIICRDTLKLPLNDWPNVAF